MNRNFMFDVFCALFLLICTIEAQRSFVIDYDNDRFLKDGQPFRYISGSIHYFRIPPIYWTDRLQKMKAAGLNVVQFYIPWNVHEPYPNEFNFEHDADILGFLQLAQSYDLDVILRMGPYTCGEWEAGGFPFWLYNIPNLAVRTSDPRFIFFVNRWYAKLLPMVIPYLYKNGGPVIMMQLENEYGSRPYCDQNYTSFLRDLFRSYVGDDFVLITDDGGALSYLKCGFIPGVYPTVDFGVGTRQDIAASFGAQRAYAPHGPLVNTEFYPGWLDLWGQPHSVVPIQPILESMTYMYEMGASFNFYMFEGGTNFGYMNGAGDPHLPVTTSYDYDAPLNEAGDPTQKYFAIRQMIENLTGIVNRYSVPPATVKRAYGTVPMLLYGQVTDLLTEMCPPHNVQRTVYPRTFEEIYFPYGFMLYETILQFDGFGVLSAPGVDDRGYVTVDGSFQGLITVNGPLSLQILSRNGAKLQILVENNGRQTSGVPELKGIKGNVTLNGAVLTNWIQYPLTIENIFDRIQNYSPLTARFAVNTRTQNGFAPSVYFSKLNIPNIDDTYFNPTNWGKGQFFINGVNVGRYWPSVGPQVTLYVPKYFLRNENYIVMLELETPGNCRDTVNTVCDVQFVDYPLINKSVNAWSQKQNQNVQRPFVH